MEEAHLAGLETGHVDEVVELRAQAPHAVIHRAQRLALRLARLAELLVHEHAQVADDRRQRRRELVRDVAVELGAEALHVAEPLVGRRQLGDLLLEVGDDAPALLAQPLARRVGRRHHALALPADVAGDLPGEVARVDRLLHEAVAADGEARVAIAFGRDGDDGHAVERGLGAKPERDLEAVEAGDVEVDEHEVRPLRDGEAHALEAIGSVDHLVTVGREELADEQPIARVVLDVQHARQGPIIASNPLLSHVRR